MVDIPAYNGLACLKSLWNTCMLDAVWNKKQEKHKVMHKSVLLHMRTSDRTVCSLSASLLVTT